MKLKEGFTVKTVCGDTLAIYAGENTVDLQQAIVLNDSAEFIFRNLLNETTKEEIVAEMLKKYDISKETAINDVDSFISNLSKKGYLE